MILGTAADVAGLAKSAWVTYSGPLAGGAVEEWARATAAGLVKGAGGSATTATTTTTAADLQRQHAADVAAAPPPPPIPAMLPESAKAGGRSDVGDILKATSLSFQYALQAEATHAEPGARDAFAAWAGLVAVAHPLRACRDGAASLVASLPRTWPAPAASALGPPPSPDPSLAAVPICGAATPIPPAWDGCAPSRDPAGGSRATGRRGYTCGLWQVLHALAAGHPDGAAGGEAWLAGVAAYVKHFFQCSECAAHFTDMASGADAAAVATRSDAVLWAWRAHNRVNARLAATEAATPGDGDPAHPKAPWPPRALCPGCSAPAPGPSGVPQWNEAAVADFLVRWYRAEDGAGGGATGGGGFGGGAPALPRRALGDAHGASSEGSRPLLLLAIVGLVCAAVVAATRPPPVRRGMKAAAH
jgi:thiol oxidase